MSKDGDHSAESLHTFGDAVDKGLAEAFGNAPPQRPAPSVLQALQARTGSVLGLHLDSGGLDDAPVRVTEEARKLWRDAHKREPDNATLRETLARLNVSL